MKSRTDVVLRAAKEVAVKYIESGQLPLSSFDKAFRKIYHAIDRAVAQEDEPTERSTE